MLQGSLDLAEAGSARCRRNYPRCRTTPNPSPVIGLDVNQRVDSELAKAHRAADKVFFDARPDRYGAFLHWLTASNNGNPVGPYAAPRCSPKIPALSNSGRSSAPKWGCPLRLRSTERSCFDLETLCEPPRSNSWAECRDTKCRHRADGEIFLLTFSFIGLLR